MKISNTDLTDEAGLPRQESFDRVYAKLHQAVYANIFKIVRNHSTAEDLLQDVFVSFWEHMEELDPGRVPNWLFVVSFNKSLSHLKKSARINTRPFPSLFDPVEDIPEIDEREFEEKLLLVYEAIELLPDRKKQIFRQYRVEGKTAEQIAAEMQLSIHTVKDHLKVANKMIREYLGQSIPLKPGIYLALAVFLQVY